MGSYDFVLLTPLKEELDIVREVFDMADEPESENNLLFYNLDVGPDLEGVAVPLNQMGNVTAARKTERILTTLADHNLGLVVLLGIGGAISDDLGLGDVVVGTEITNYQVRSKVVDAQGEREFDSDDDESTHGASTEKTSSSASESNDDSSTLSDLTPSGWEWLPGGLTRRVNEDVEQAIDTFRNNPTLYENWQDSVSVFRSREVELSTDGVTPDMFHEPPLVHHEPIASGGMVIASRAFGEQLDAQNRNFALVEMEAAGVMEVVDTTPGVNALVLRGVSDFADERKSELDNANKGQWRTYATYAAAEYLRHFLEAGLLEIGAADHNLPIRGSPHRETVSADQEDVREESQSDEAVDADQFELYPIQESGHNFFHRDRETGANRIPIGDTVPLSEWEEFLVCTHFDFWSKPSVSIIDIDLDYEISGEKRVIEKDVEADGEDIPTDQTSPRRLANHIESDANERTEIQVSQRFKSEPFAASDYGQLVLTFELTGPEWHGIKLLTIIGTLEAGGKLLIQEKAIAPKPVNPQ